MGKRRWLRRTVIAVVSVVVVLVLVAVGGVAWLWFRVPHNNLAVMKPGGLTVNASGTYVLAGYSVKIDNSQVQIVETDSGAVVWHNNPGSAFLLASAGSFDTRDHLGYFWANVDRTRQYTSQTISNVSNAGGKVSITGELSSSDSVKAPFTFTLGVAKGQVSIAASVGADDQNTKPTSLELSSGRDSGELVHGFGEQYAPYNLDGRAWPVMIGEQGIGRGAEPVSFMVDITNWAAGDLGTTYAAWPEYITSKNRALSLDASAQESGSFGIIDLTDPATINYELWSSQLAAHTLAGSSPIDLITKRDAGQTRPPLADWVQQGAVLGVQGGTQRVRQIVDEMLAAGTRLSAVWIQDWTGKRTTSFGSRLWWSWQLNNSAYPGWDQMVKDFAAKGIRVLTYVNTYVVPLDGPDAPQVGSLYNEAATKGYLVLDPQHQPYLIDQNGFSAAIVDLTNPAAMDWYAHVIAKDILGVGASGFMADFGEDLPYDAIVHDGNANAAHGNWPRLWAQTVNDACQLAKQPDCVTFFRSGALGMSQYAPMAWNGDQLVTYDQYDGMESALLGKFSMGVSGMPLAHSDIGGYTSVNVKVKNYVRPPDLNARWAEMEAFGPMMRTHETNLPDDNLQVYSNPQQIQEFARASRIFAALGDYRKIVTEIAQKTGVPAIRHTSLEFPGTAAAQSDSQFFFGDSVLVAPVMQEGATSVSVSFPPGQWINLFTGQAFSGNTVAEVSAPIGSPAAFVRADDPAGTKIRRAFTAAGLA